MKKKIFDLNEFSKISLELKKKTKKLLYAMVYLIYCILVIFIILNRPKKR